MAENEAVIEGVDKSLYPKHIAFIMDGNGRWAKKRMLPRTAGHVMGAKQFKNIVTHCRRLGIEYITFYAFSTENWKRPKNEVDAIIKLFHQYVIEFKKFYAERTRIIFIGRRTDLPEDVRNKMEMLEEETKDFEKMTLLIALNYGGRDEITHSARELAVKVKNGELNPEDITEDMVDDNLYTKGIPDVDLLIRPSGEYRISNFLLWQSAYAEFYFTNVLWPDFNTKELEKAMIDFSGRKRRYGGI